MKVNVPIEVGTPQITINIVGGVMTADVKDTAKLFGISARKLHDLKRAYPEVVTKVDGSVLFNVPRLYALLDENAGGQIRTD